MKYKTLSEEFLQAMDEICIYGELKYCSSLKELVGKRPDRHRWQKEEIAKHAADHFKEYLQGFGHDAFGTLKHQLAAVAVNAMLEFLIAGLEKEGRKDGDEDAADAAFFAKVYQRIRDAEGAARQADKQDTIDFPEEGLRTTEYDPVKDKIRRFGEAVETPLDRLFRELQEKKFATSAAFATAGVAYKKAKEAAECAQIELTLVADEMCRLGRK